MIYRTKTYAIAPAPQSNTTGFVEEQMSAAAPRYLGKYMDTTPTGPFAKGDTYCRYSTTSGTANRGVFKWDGSAWERTEAVGEVTKALADISFLIAYTNTSGVHIYGQASDYSGDSTVQANFAFFQAAVVGYLEAQEIVLNTSGKIRSSNYVAGSSGFQINANGDAELGSARVRGSLEGDLNTAALSSYKNISLPTWNSSASYTGASVYSHFSTLSLSSRYSASSGSTFDGKAVSSVMRLSFVILIETNAGNYELQNNSTTYTYTGSITLDNNPYTSVKGDMLPLTDSQYSLGSATKYFQNAYVDEGTISIANISLIQHPNATQVPKAGHIDAGATDTYDIGATRRFNRIYGKNIYSATVTASGAISASSVSASSLSGSVDASGGTLRIPAVNGIVVYLRMDRNTNRLQYSEDNSTWTNVNTGL